MLNSELLLSLIREKSTDLKKFAERNGIKYTTLYNATLNDEKLAHMNISMFMSVAKGLDMNTDDLIRIISYE